MNRSASVAAVAVGCRSPFTDAQWQELGHQALIFKYLMAGVPVPPELIIPIRRSFEALPRRYYHHHALGYCSNYGKKMDLEPGRCRRTDGKKWRCSKDAYPDSKYCERHMHRGRNRSRKPVESQTASHINPTGSGTNASGNGSLQIIPLHSVVSCGSTPSSCLSGASSSQLPRDSGPVGNRCFAGVIPEVDEHSLSFKTSGSARGLGIDHSGDGSWHLMPSGVSSFPLPKAKDHSLMHSAYSQLQSGQDLGQVTISTYPKQHSFFGSDLIAAHPGKNESQSLRLFFDEWPKARDSWSDLEEDRSNQNSFSTTQLSISIPKAPSDFCTSSSRSPNNE